MSKRSKILLVGFYFSLAVLFTWPLATTMTTNGFGYDEDAPYHIWHNWWLKYSLFDLKQNPLHTDYIFHPQKINLIYDANSFVFATMTIPLQFMTQNVVLASNIIFLISFALSGLTAFLLCDYLIKNKWVALICGFIFAFNPYTTAQAVDGHTNLTTTWIIPVYILFLLKSLNASRANTQKFQISNFKFQIAAGLMAALQLYNDFTYTAFLIIETGLILTYFLIQLIISKKVKERVRRFAGSGLIIACVALISSSPILNEIFQAGRQGLRAGSPLWVQNIWSADLLTFIRPNDQTTFLKNPWTPNIGTVEGTAFVGYSVLGLLILYSLWLIVKRKKGSEKEILPKIPQPTINVSSEPWNVNLWIFLTVSFFVLMLGPSLHFRNNFQFSILNSQLIFPLPYLLLHKIPFIGETQEPGRMFPFFILPVSILVATAIKKITEKIPARFFFLLLISYFSLLIFEYLTIPFPSTDLSPIPIFEAIRRDPDQKTVLTLPLGFNSGNYVLGQSPIGSLQFYQAYFQKPSFRGTVARLPYSNFEYYLKIPTIAYLLDPHDQNQIQGIDLLEERKLLKNALNIKYILVFEKKYKRPIGQTLEFLENKLQAQKFYDVDGVKGYLLD